VIGFLVAAATTATTAKSWSPYLHPLQTPDAILQRGNQYILTLHDAPELCEFILIE
jgi:hypothetical protein